MSHAFINIIVPFADDNWKRVNDLLKSYTDPAQGNQPQGDVKRALDKCGVIHFMSMTVARPICPSETAAEVLADDPDLADKPAHLIIEISADGNTEEVLEKLATELKDELDEVLREALGDDAPTPLHEFLKGHSVDIKAPFAWASLVKDWPLLRGWIKKNGLGQIHAGSPGMTVKRICAEHKLAQRIGELIDEARESQCWEKSSPRQRLDYVRNKLWTDQLDKWAFMPEPAPLLGGSPNPERSITNWQFIKAIRAAVWTFLKPAFLLIGLVLLTVVGLTLTFLEGYKIAALWTTWVAVLLLTSLAIAVGIGFGRLAYLEKRDPEEDRTPSEDRVQEIMKLENFGVQNHLASISRLKKGFLRKLTLRLAFIIVGTGHYVGAPGFLGKNGVIHFARWMRLPKTNQLFFWSNYGGTWDSYVGDFIADAPSGVTAIWSNCIGFPRTSGLLSKGATKRDRLVRWARRQQHPTVFWYSAYPKLTAARIRTNAAIRQGLASADSDADARDWLSLFGSAPRPAAALELAEIPTLVFGGLSSLRYSACHVIELDSDPESSRKWLENATAYATYGERDPGERFAVVIALSASGLKKLGVREDALDTFPVAFQQGMWPEWRARALGDSGDNHPKNWKWGVPPEALPPGAPAKPADVLLLVYGLEEKDLVKVQNRLLTEDQKLGRNCFSLRLKTLALKPRVLASTAAAPQAQPRANGATADQDRLQGSRRPGESAAEELDATRAAEAPHQSSTARTASDRRWTSPHEAFGFADGVSQPVIRGAPRANTRRSKHHMIEAGEIVLGYPDNLGQIPPAPTIPAKYDPDHFLPDAGPDPFRQRPEFSCYEGTGQRDLGANGTFLVVRQLEQDVFAFRRWLRRTMRRLKHHHAGMTLAVGHRSMRMRAGGRPLTFNDHDPAADLRGSADALWREPSTRKRIMEFIAAKAMGRWRDGTSLVRYPVRPGTQNTPPDNPDNDFLLGAEDPVGLNCPFGAHVRRANPRDARFPGSKDEIDTVNRHRMLRVGRSYKLSKRDQGLLFMCLNADIDRQFEFVQKTWLLNRNMHGLEDEIDPIIGREKRTLTIPTQTGPIELEIEEYFVKVIGGGYFFLPGRAVLRYLATYGRVGAGETVPPEQSRSESREPERVT